MDRKNQEIYYFDPNTEVLNMLTKIIKKQGEIACQNKLDIDYLPLGSSEADISSTIENYKNGFASITKKAQIGRSLRNISDKYHLNGFIIYSLNPKLHDEIIVKLICSDKNAKIGKELMKLVEDKAKELKIKKLTLFSLAETKLKKWYESLGFSMIETLYLSKDLPKAYYMVKYI